MIQTWCDNCGKPLGEDARRKSADTDPRHHRYCSACWFRAARLGLGLTQRALAEAIGVSTTMIRHIEHGRRNVSRQTAASLRLLQNQKTK